MIKKTLAILAVIVAVAVAIVVYSFLKKPEAASGPIEAIPIAATAEQPAAPAATAGPTDVAQGAAPTAEPTLAAETEAPTEATTVAEAPEPSAPDVAAEPTIFEIVSSESSARFLIDEVLRGSPTTVVGSTDQVAGQIAIDPGDLSTAQVGIIQVNARTLTTDNEFRNRAIKNRILQTNDHELVVFAPQKVVGLAGAGTPGESYTFQIVGDLTITGVTREVTFDVVVTPLSATRLEGLATTAFLYTDFELFIPDAPAVDTVEDEVRLEFEFVAEAAS